MTRNFSYRNFLNCRDTAFNTKAQHFYNPFLWDTPRLSAEHVASVVLRVLNPDDGCVDLDLEDITYLRDNAQRLLAQTMPYVLKVHHDYSNF